MAWRGSVIFCCKSNMVYLRVTKRGSVVSWLVIVTDYRHCISYAEAEHEPGTN